MASKTAKMRQAEERIKRAIVTGHRNGVCDKDGNSEIGAHGFLIPKSRNLGTTAKTFVYRDGRMVEKLERMVSNRTPKIT